MRSFVRLRQLLATHADLAKKLDELEAKYDQQFQVVFQAIKQLMTPESDTQKTRSGFGWSNPFLLLHPHVPWIGLSKFQTFQKTRPFPAQLTPLATFGYTGWDSTTSGVRRLDLEQPSTMESFNQECSVDYSTLFSFH